MEWIRMSFAYALSRSFFFSSRRRHTRWPRDWSSDVCSSDLLQAVEAEVGTNSRLDSLQAAVLLAKLPHLASWSDQRRRRSEERRVGKECGPGRRRADRKRRAPRSREVDQHRVVSRP